jgi:hypothetical protein
VSLAAPIPFILPFLLLEAKSVEIGNQRCGESGRRVGAQGLAEIVDLLGRSGVEPEIGGHAGDRGNTRPQNVAELSYRFIERPFLRLKRFFPLRVAPVS